ncbi:MAG: aminotransferase [Desulfuromonadaceae bacterium]|nr:aminotransferase [Desulfuromonadaceae bacterium]
MKFKISSSIEVVQFPPITEVHNWLANAPASSLPLIDLCQAVPSWPTAEELTGHLRERLTDPLIARYTPDEGLPEVRMAVSTWLRALYGNGPETSEICLSIGASQAFWLAITTLCQAGDEVIVQSPAYFDHPMALAALGVCPVFTAFNPESAGQPDLAEVEQLITPRTRALLLVTPSNPTGAVIPAATIQRLYELAAAHNIALILDETYHCFLPEDEPPHALFNNEEWGDHFIQLLSFGKTFALTGYRAGALVASAAFIRQALKVQDSMVVCQPRISQTAIKFGCEHLDDWVARNRKMMNRRHDRFCTEFGDDDNLFTIVASGAFFAWVKHPFNGHNGREVARALVEKARIICLPGEAFGPNLEGYLRLAFGNIDDEQIPEAAHRFREFSL